MTQKIKPIIRTSSEIAAALARRGERKEQGMSDSLRRWVSTERVIQCCKCRTIRRGVFPNDRICADSLAEKGWTATDKGAICGNCGG